MCHIKQKLGIVINRTGCGVRYHPEVWYLTKLTFQELKAHNMYCLYNLLVGSALVTQLILMFLQELPDVPLNL